jgi:hypothetical protein
MSWVITPTNLLVDDQDALTYLTAVEAADGQALESGVRLAVNAFIKGCKNDGIWPAIKAGCILAGARTLGGCLVPLVGTAPTNFNFASGDYNRKTGLVGDGSAKYLNSNRNNNADPQNSQHLFARSSTVGANTRAYMGAGGAENGASFIGIGTAVLLTRSRNTTGVAGSSLTTATNVGLSRASASEYSTRCVGLTNTTTQASQTPVAGDIHVFQRNAASPLTTDARLAFYSIGEAIDLALLDTRVTTLINAIAAAIP